jgi:hypothetical protein
MHWLELESTLWRVLLTTVPVATSGCLAMSSCPDDDAPKTYVEIRSPDAGAPDAGSVDGGASGDCLTLCGHNDMNSEPLGCEPTNDGTGNTSCTYPAICEGRRPAGLRRGPRRAARDSVLGGHFARMAYYEAASVPAFAALERELRAHSAPAELRTLARGAARDEVRHAKLASGLARRFGASATRPRVERRPVRSLLEVAIENAREGCVRETYGALVALWQGRLAEDERVRAAMAEIARDEVKHAALAWAVARWARAKLDRADNARVERERRAAFDELAASVLREPPQALVREAGLPRAAHAAALVEELQRALASA